MFHDDSLVKLCVHMETPSLGRLTVKVSLLSVSPPPPLRFRYTFELYLTSEKLYQFGLETADALHSWTKSIGKV